MKYSLDAFDQLQDFASYIGRGYLNCELSSTVLDQITYLNGAFAYLLDRLLFKENCGSQITEEVQNSILVSYDGKKLSEVALTINEESKDDNFLKDKSSFSKYYEFIIETEKYVPSALLDEYGSLTLVYLKILSSLIEIDVKMKGLDPLKINEIIFLNGTYSIMLILKGFLGQKFSTLKSFEFFDGVAINAEIIRSQILD